MLRNGEKCYKIFFGADLLKSGYDFRTGFKDIFIRILDFDSIKKIDIRYTKCLYYKQLSIQFIQPSA